MALRFVSVLLCTIFAITVALPPPPPTGDCGRYAERQTCGSACAPTCANPMPGPTCVLPCVDACFCKEGYLKANNGECVPAEACPLVPHLPNMEIPQLNAAAPPKCASNEEYRTCGSACIASCAMPIPRPWCTRQCAAPGCFCVEGYLRNENNVCIQAAKCKKSIELIDEPIRIPLHRIPLNPPSCPTKDEHYIPCGVQMDCLASCKIPMTPKCLERQCTPGCVCKKPLVRYVDGRCVEQNQCPKE